jgi:proton glutamate symport protein
LGLKSLVYFEVVTTLALGIGLVAINLSKAGVGLTLPAAAMAQPVAAAAPVHWDDFLLHIFPENIAKSIAEGQILQVAVFRGADSAGSCVRRLLRHCAGNDE